MEHGGAEGAETDTEGVEVGRVVNWEAVYPV